MNINNTSNKKEVKALKDQQKILLQQNKENFDKLKQMDNTIVISHKKISKLDSAIKVNKDNVGEVKKQVQKLPTNEVKKVFDNIFPPNSTGGKSAGESGHYTSGNN